MEFFTAGLFVYVAFIVTWILLTLINPPKRCPRCQDDD